MSELRHVCTVSMYVNSNVTQTESVIHARASVYVWRKIYIYMHKFKRINILPNTIRKVCNN